MEMKLGVLLGGRSSERSVSLASGDACARALESLGHDVMRIDASGDWVAELSAARPDVVLNMLHGGQGEDGTVQGVLECLEIPYSHSGVLASALAMDKQRCKPIYRACGIPVAHSVEITARDLAQAHPMDGPYVIKPVTGGSSVGVTLVTDLSQPPQPLATTPDERVMVETYVRGREFTVSVLQDRAITVTEILTDGWYDFDAKYSAGRSRHVLPADIPQPIFDACMDHARAAHHALGCRGVSRSDFRWDDERGLDGLAILETNTQPGMTPTSLTPEQAAHIGIGLPELCALLINDASLNR